MPIGKMWIKIIKIEYHHRHETTIAVYCVCGFSDLQTGAGSGRIVSLCFTMLCATTTEKHAKFACFYYRITGIRSYRMHCIDAAYCYRCCTYSVVYVCLCWALGWVVQKQLNRSTCWLVHVSQGNHVLDGVHDPSTVRTFWGCPAHWKALGSRVSAAVQCSRLVGVAVKNPPPCDAVFRQNSLTA